MWLGAAIVGPPWLLAWLFWPLVIVSLLTTCYTGFLFEQGLARDLWQGPQSTVDLLAQAIVEGCAVLLLASFVPGVTAAPGVVATLAVTLVVAMLVHLALVAFENLVMPSPTRHHQLAVDAIRRGPFAQLFWGGAIGTAAMSAIVGALWSGMPAAVALAAGLALAGSFAWEYIWVEAGQSVPFDHDDVPVASGSRRRGTTTSISNRRAGRRRTAGTTGSFRASASTANRPAASSPTSTRNS